MGIRWLVPNTGDSFSLLCIVLHTGVTYLLVITPNIIFASTDYLWVDSMKMRYINVLLHHTYLI